MNNYKEKYELKLNFYFDGGCKVNQKSISRRGINIFWNNNMISNQTQQTYLMYSYKEMKINYPRCFRFSLHRVARKIVTPV